MCFDYQDITHTCFYVNNFYNANTLIPFLQRRKIASVFLSGSRGATGPGRPARRGPARPGRPGAGPDRPFVPGKYGGQFLLKMKGCGEKYGGSQIGDGPVDYWLQSTPAPIRTTPGPYPNHPRHLSEPPPAPLTGRRKCDKTYCRIVCVRVLADHVPRRLSSAWQR